MLPPANSAARRLGDLGLDLALRLGRLGQRRRRRDVVLLELGVGLGLQGERRFVSAWSVLSWAWARLKSASLASSFAFWTAVWARRSSAAAGCRATDWLSVAREASSLDLLGEGDVLVADVEVVADVGQGVGEGVGRQDGLEERCAGRS